MTSQLLHFEFHEENLIFFFIRAQGGFPTELTRRRIIVLSERVYVIKYENKQKEWHPATKPYL